jgi:lipopolysaccharide assembly outer membrane protein LptD (OstA)
MVWSAIFLCGILVGQLSNASSPKAVNYRARRIAYYPPKEKVVLLESAQVHYGDITISAESIEYEINLKTLSAFKNVIFKTSSEVVNGDTLHYNLETKRGYMVNGTTKVENGVVSGKEAWIVKEKTLHIKDGYYTTCDHYPPHYYFYSPKAKVLIDNTAFAEPVILKILGIPIGAVPFWFFPVSKHRKSGVLPFKLGQSKSEGRYVKGLAYYLVINDYSDVTFSCDVFEKKGFQPKIELIYLVNPFASGQLFLSYIRETDTKKNRYSINAKHRSIFFFNSLFNSYIDFQSDERYLPDYAENRAQWLKKELYSQASLTREIKKIGRLAVRLERKDDFNKKRRSSKLPNISLNFYRLSLVKNWNLTPGISYVNIKDVIHDTNRTRITNSHLINWHMHLSNPNTCLGNFDLPLGFSFDRQNNYDGTMSSIQKFGFNTALDFSQTIIQGINWSQSIKYSQFFISNQQNGGGLSFSLGLNTNLYRLLYPPQRTSLTSLLHRLTPVIEITYEPFLKKSGLIFSPNFDTMPKEFRINFAVNNLFQGKFRSNQEKQDLTIFNLNTHYDFVQKNFAPLNINSELFLLKKSNVQLSTDLSFALAPGIFCARELALQNFYINSNFFGEWSQKDTQGFTTKGIRINLNYLLIGSERWAINSNMMNLTFSLIPPGWQFNFSTGINFNDPQRIANYSLEIYKDLHCWEAVADINKFGLLWSYDFKIRIKKIPEVSFSKGMLGFILP